VRYDLLAQVGKLDQETYEQLVEGSARNFLAQTMLTDFANGINKREMVLSQWHEVKPVLDRIYFPGLLSMDVMKMSSKQKSYIHRFKIYGDVLQSSFYLEQFRLSMVALSKLIEAFEEYSRN